MSDQLLDLDLNSVDTSFKVIKSGVYDLTIKEVDVVPNNANDGEMLKFTYHTTKPGTDIKGEPLDPGFAIFDRVSLKTKSDKKDEKAMQEIIVKNAARILQAIQPPVSGITGRDLFDGSIKVKCKALAGRLVQAKVDALPERKDKSTGKTLAPGNEVAQYIKKG